MCALVRGAPGHTSGHTTTPRRAASCVADSLADAPKRQQRSAAGLSRPLPAMRLRRLPASLPESLSAPLDRSSCLSQRSEQRVERLPHVARELLCARDGGAEHGSRARGHAAARHRSLWPYRGASRSPPHARPGPPGAGAARPPRRTACAPAHRSALRSRGASAPLYLQAHPPGPGSWPSGQHEWARPHRGRSAPALSSEGGRAR